MNKAEGTLQQQIAATAAPAYEVSVPGAVSPAEQPAETGLRQALGAPERVQEDFDGKAVGAHLYLKVDAAVDVPQVERIPALRGRALYEPEETAARLVPLLLGDGPYTLSGADDRRRLSEHMELLQTWMDALLDKPYGPGADYDRIREELQRNFDVYAQVYAEADPARSPRPWTGTFADVKVTDLWLSKGDATAVLVHSGYFIELRRADHPESPPPLFPRGPQGEAEERDMAIAVRFADSLGFAKTAPGSINALDEFYRRRYPGGSGFDSGYSFFTLLPVYEGIPVYAYNTFTGTDTGMQAAGYAYSWDLPQEELDGVLYRGEVVRFKWSCPFFVTGVENENVPLLPFDRIMDIFRQQVCRSIYLDEGHDMTLCVTDIRLSYMRVKVRDSKDYYLLPVWDFLGSQDTEDMFARGENTTLLTLNAVDGSVLNRRLGY